MKVFKNNTTGLLIIASVFMLVIASCSQEPEKPEKGSEAYKKAVSDFYVSLAAIQADQAIFAVDKMDSLSQKYPQESAIWANLAVFSMRQGNFEGAEKQIQKALDRAEYDASIIFLAGIIESRRGNVDQSIEYLRKAAEKDPDNPKIAFALADELQRQDAAANTGEVISILQSMLDTQPDNLAVLLEMVRTSVKQNDKESLKKAMNALDEQAKNWPEEVRRQFNDTKETILADSGGNQTFQLAFLRNNLNQLPKFQSDLAEVQIPPNQVGFLITEFSWLPQPETTAAEPDTAMTFEPEDIPEPGQAELVKSVALSDNPGVTELRVADGRATLDNDRAMSFPGRVNSKHAAETIDYNYDFLNDIAFAGSSGFKLYRQQEDSSFTDVTASTGLPSSILTKSYVGVWARDVDLDGDLDLVMSPQEGSVFLLRNNGDDTFQRADFLGDIASPRDFQWADLDGDSDADAVFLDKSGDVVLVMNERSSTFKKADGVPELSNAKAIAISDINNDGDFDILVWSKAAIHRLWHNQETAGWESEKMTDLPASFKEAESKTAFLYSVDLDNNGANDILVSTPQQSGYWLNGEDLKINSRFKDLPSNIYDIADLNEDTRLDLVSLDEEGQVRHNINKGTMGYIARIIRPRASGPLGDRRINSFGIGGEIEIRSGLLYEKQLIRQPWVHLGLGTYQEADLLRIIWPNGSNQAEFAELGYGSEIFNEQILKGSCPWVFTYNGEEMEFVTDFLWKTALGLRINTQGVADVLHSVDWIKIDGNQLKPRDGTYDLRITADLWESHFFDEVSLMTVDHPEGTEVFVDERFTTPQKASELYAVKTPQPVAKAVDQDGRDVTSKIRDYDNNYVDSFGLTKYQGVAKEHYLEVQLGDEVPLDQPVRLVAAGWVYPTDTSVNIALSQGDQKNPEPISLQVPDGKGGWKIARENIGFPAGKSKTMMIDLDGIFEPGAPRKVRLVTSMEIYWNQIRWAVEDTESTIEKKTVDFSKAELRYRGFSQVKRPGRFIPEQPNYRQISGTTPKWHDLEGYYTRYGEVDELVQKTDDRYVIMNAGDELAFEFPVPKAPAPGMVRDFVLVGDGWLKDGDYNTGYSKTLRPLPYHGMEDYSKAPVPLHEDPVYQEHKQDWVEYHTRYVTPRGYRSALIFDK